MGTTSNCAQVCNGAAVLSGTQGEPRGSGRGFDSGQALIPHSSATALVGPVTSYHCSSRPELDDRARRQPGVTGFSREGTACKRGAVHVALPARTVPATQGLHLSLLGPPPSGRQRSATAPHYPPKVRPGPSHRPQMDMRAAVNGPHPGPRVSAATKAAGGPGWGPMEPTLQRNSPLRLLRPGPELERKEHARRGVSSVLACVAPSVRTRALPGVASAVPERLTERSLRR